MLKIWCCANINNLQEHSHTEYKERRDNIQLSAHVLQLLILFLLNIKTAMQGKCVNKKNKNHFDIFSKACEREGKINVGSLLISGNAAASSVRLIEIWRLHLHHNETQHYYKLLIRKGLEFCYSLTCHILSKCLAAFYAFPNILHFTLLLFFWADNEQKAGHGQCRDFSLSGSFQTLRHDTM